MIQGLNIDSPNLEMEEKWRGEREGAVQPKREMEEEDEEMVELERRI